MDESFEVSCDSSTVAPGELWRTGRLRWPLWGLLIAGCVWGPVCDEQTPHPTPEATERVSAEMVAPPRCGPGAKRRGDGCGCPPGSSRHISRRGFVKFHPLVKLISGSSLFAPFLRLARLWRVAAEPR